MKEILYDKLFSIKEKFISENFGNLKSSALVKKIEELQDIINEFNISRDMLTNMIDQYKTKKNTEQVVYSEEDMYVDFFGSKIPDMAKNLMIGLNSARVGTAEEVEKYNKTIDEYNSFIEKFEADHVNIVKSIEELNQVLKELREKHDIIKSEERLFNDIVFSSESERTVAIANSRIIARTFEPVLSRLNDIEDMIENITKKVNKSNSDIEDLLKSVKQLERVIKSKQDE